jgi:uncharacterized protein YegL
MKNIFLRKLVAGISLAGLLLFQLVPVVSAQNSPDGSGSVFIDSVDLTAFPSVTVEFSAWDANGLPLDGLTPEDVILQENGGAAFHPGTVTADTRAPLQIALVIDVSGSMNGQPLADAKSSAARFLDRLNPGDQAAVVAFSDSVDSNPENLNPKRELALSKDLLPAYNLIDSLQATGGTELYNAITKAVRMMESAPSGHRAVLLLSDGKNDPPTSGDPQEAIDLAKKAHVPVFVIGLGSQIDEPYLRGLAAQTGGLFRAAPASYELGNLFSDMAILLKTRYTLTYPSGLAPDGRSLVLNVALKSQKSVIETSIESGPLPAASTATETAQSTSTPLPPTQTAAPAPTSTPVSTAVASSASNAWGWVVAIGIALSTVAAAALRRKSATKPHPKPEACSKCGFDLTGVSGPCPQCGEPRRLSK